ncbi:MAG TPA: Xaa-Pro peptidase family protein [Chloroflexota bacterium]|nr:Xaa-Pro peptidase family protein [Chloroflexota bacterium]
MPIAELDPRPLFYCGDELQQAKLERVQAAMQTAELDALLLVKHDAVRYVTGFYAKGYRPFIEIEYLALVLPEGLPVLGTSLAGEEGRATLRSRTSEVRTLPGWRAWGSALAGILAERGLIEAGIGYDLMPLFLHDELMTALPNARFVDASDIWSQITAVKLPGEIALLRKALEIAQSGMDAALDAVRPGISEIEVAAEAEYVMRRAGSEMNPFIPVVASGPNAAVWERVATPRTIQSGEMVILDFGCVWNGYTGDFARTTVTGEPTAEQKRLYRGAYRALQEAIGAVRPGVPCGGIDSVARRVLREEGLERYAAPWAIGHQLGYGLHGSPALARGVEAELQPGMVINIEPALYTPDDLTIGGVELEDTVLVTDSGAERLTSLGYDERFL